MSRQTLNFTYQLFYDKYNVLVLKTYKQYRYFSAKVFKFF